MYENSISYSFINDNLIHKQLLLYYLVTLPGISGTIELYFFIILPMILSHLVHAFRHKLLARLWIPLYNKRLLCHGVHIFTAPSAKLHKTILKLFYKPPPHPHPV
jgi:hypothetical protein